MRGFTLIEVVVAFALLAFALTLLLGAMTRATTQVRNAEHAGRAALHAQTLLHQVGVGEPLVPGTSEGVLEDGRYRWTLQVAEWQDPDPAAAAHAATLRDLRAPRLLELELVVAWGEGGERERLVVRSLRRVQVPG
ncbi:MAG TPA: prepilin-type N-terminal cleavage/methylation domain-containing protein [Xanthomonadaceae bacterium]|nr:prepilin-type N-terminal cleavage/methylation domain-containing protein [Xanthomonadaceae bacterium]